MKRTDYSDFFDSFLHFWMKWIVIAFCFAVAVGAVSLVLSLLFEKFLM